MKKIIIISMLLSACTSLQQKELKNEIEIARIRNMPLIIRYIEKLKREDNKKVDVAIRILNTTRIKINKVTFYVAYQGERKTAVLKTFGYIKPGKDKYVFIWGDVFVFKRKNIEIRKIKIKFENNKSIVYYGIAIDWLMMAKI